MEAFEVVRSMPLSYSTVSYSLLSVKEVAGRSVQVNQIFADKGKVRFKLCMRCYCHLSNGN